MIASIKNSWLRRSLLVMYCCVMIPLQLALVILEVFVNWIENEFSESIVNAWKGPPVRGRK